MVAKGQPRSSVLRPACETGSIGLLVLIALGSILLLVAGGYWYLKDTGERLQTGFETMDRAMRHLDGLEIMYPFELPADRAVDSVRADDFAMATAEAWPRMEGSMSRVEGLYKKAQESGNPGLRTRAAGWGAVGEATLIHGETLSRFEMSMSEYLWTGFQLLRAAGYVDDIWGWSDPVPAPPRNRALAQRHGTLLGAIRDAVADSMYDGVGTVYWAGWALGVRNRKVASSAAVQDISETLESLSPPKASEER